MGTKSEQVRLKKVKLERLSDRTYLFVPVTSWQVHVEDPNSNRISQRTVDMGYADILWPHLPLLTQCMYDSVLAGLLLC